MHVSHFEENENKREFERMKRIFKMMNLAEEYDGDDDDNVSCSKVMRCGTRDERRRGPRQWQHNCNVQSINLRKRKNERYGDDGGGGEIVSKKLARMTLHDDDDDDDVFINKATFIDNNNTINDIAKEKVKNVDWCDNDDDNDEIVRIRKMIDCDGNASPIAALALQTAVCENKLTLVNYLLSYVRIDPNIHNCVAMYAATTREVVSMDMIQMLLLYGADVSRVGHGAFILAASKGHLDIVRLFLSKMTLAGNIVRIALKNAMANNHTNVVAVLSAALSAAMLSDDHDDDHDERMATVFGRMTA